MGATCSFPAVHCTDGAVVYKSDTCVRRADQQDSSQQSDVAVPTADSVKSQLVQKLDFVAEKKVSSNKSRVVRQIPVW